MFDEKGQAMMTFKILIAAVVAMAVLALLLPMISRLSGVISTKPIDAINQRLDSAISAPGTASSEVVTFSSSATSRGIISDALVAKTGYSADHFHFCSSSPGVPNVEVGDSYIRYTGTTGAIKAKVTVGCIPDASKAGTTLSNMGLDGCDCGNQNTGLCCVVKIEPI